MEELGVRTLIEYKYNSEEEARRHEGLMISKGWVVESSKSYFIKHFRSYSKRREEGMFFNKRGEESERRFYMS